MGQLTKSEKESLQRYADGLVGTRRTIEALGMHDYSDLMIAMAEAGLNFPKPSPTPAHEANVARARAILQPLLRHDG